MFSNIFTVFKEPLNKKRIIFLSLLMGIFMALATPPFNLYLLEFFVFIPGFYLFHERNNHLKGKHFFLYGYLFSFVFLFFGFYFLIYTIQVFGNIAPFASFLSFLGYIGLMAIKTGLLFLFPYIMRKRYNYPVLLSFLIGVFLVENYFPEVLPYYFGNFQLNHTYFNQIADIIGVKGLSILIVLINYIIYQYICKREKRKLLVLVIIFFSTYSYSFLRFIQIKSLTNIKKNYTTLHIGVIQPNMQFTGDLEKIDFYNRKLINMTDRLIKNSKKPFDLIIWPESTIPFIINQPSKTPYVKRTLDYIEKLEVPLFYSSLIKREKNNKIQYFNDAILHIPGKPQQYFDKVKLLPFGEFMPLEEYFPKLRDYIEQVGNLSKGNEIKNFVLPNNMLITPQICYEITSPEFTQKFTKQGSKLIINISNDMWFGDSNASLLHLWAASFRALENRIPIVRANNSGITTVIDITGKIVTQKTPILSEASLDYNVNIFHGITSIYYNFGDLPVNILMIYLLISGFFYQDTKRPFFLKWIKKKSKPNND